MPETGNPKPRTRNPKWGTQNLKPENGLLSQVERSATLLEGLADVPLPALRELERVDALVQVASSH